MIPENILIFAGAGASKAVAPSKYPTTVEFFQSLPQSIKRNQLFIELERFLTRDGDKKLLDIEIVLWRLQELLDFCREASDQTQLTGWMLSNNRLPNVIGQTSSTFGHLSTIVSTARVQLEALIGQINARVYELYSTLPSSEEIDDNWTALLNGCTRLGPRVEIFTTNYDMVIEAALDGTGVADNGWRGTVVRKLETDLWSADASQRTKGLLTKLHGSLNWTRDKNQIYVSDPMFKGSHDSHVIIYPGFKGRPSDPTFQLFHSYFQKCLTAASVAVFIGFAFRDDYINDICDRGVSAQTATVVINPSRVTLPFSVNRHVYLDSGFGADAVDRALEFARSNIRSAL
jgi:hypothetical protein